MSTTPLFISGMFRSGTTLLGRMLNAHPQIVLASDPYLPFFKTFRSQLAALSMPDSNPDYPLSDYYFSPSGIALFRRIQDSSLDLPFDESGLDALRKRIRTYGEPYSPKLMPHLHEIAGATYTEIFGSMLELIRRYQAKGRGSIIGFKEVWADEFIPGIARGVPTAKFIQIIRDPRAVCGSKNVCPPRYPWLFLARQWRKLTALAWKYRQPNALLDNRVFCIRYEDLVTEPNRTATAICKFLGIDFAPTMVDPALYVDGKGQPWKQNTSCGEGKQQFDPSSVDKWRRVLSPQEIALIETICGPEMSLLDYSPDIAERCFTRSLLLSPPRVAESDLAAWTLDILPNNPLHTTVEMSKETIREQLLNARKDELENVFSEIIEGSFLFPDLFDKLRQGISQKTSG
ncbi:MAG TPA: sulfotransferase [bacterium]|nr:sulfotransferase [bacterium]HQL61777.1 sulfotransferase [bacterium]